DLLVGLPALELPADDLAELAREVRLGDQPLAERDVDLAVGAALPDVVDEDARPLQDPRIELLLAFEVGAERRDVRPRGDPRVVDEIAPRMRAGHDNVGAAHGPLDVGRRHEREVRVPRLLLLEEPVERRPSPAPDPDLAPGEDLVAGGERALADAPATEDREHLRVLPRQPFRRDRGRGT